MSELAQPRPNIGLIIHGFGGPQKERALIRPITQRLDGLRLNVECTIGKWLYDSEVREQLGRCAAVLALNQPRRGVDGYVGKEELRWMGIAHELGEPIFLANCMPDMPRHRRKLEDLGVTPLNGNIGELPRLLAAHQKAAESAAVTSRNDGE